MLWVGPVPCAVYAWSSGGSKSRATVFSRKLGRVSRVEVPAFNTELLCDSSGGDPIGPPDAAASKPSDTQEVGTQSTLEQTSVPSYRELIVYTSATILIWLSEPLLSLVDTTVVGLTQKNARLQLASMGPATTLIDSLLYLTYFLAIATTNLISRGLVDNDYRQLQRSTSHVMGVAAALGIVTTVTLLAGGKLLLRAIIGSSCSPELLRLAFRYTSIRAMVSVSAVVGMTAQSFCLATLNTKTPGQAVVVASVINVVGDLCLSRWGVGGAAVATAVSSVVSSIVLVDAVRRQMDEWRDLELSNPLGSGSVEKAMSASRDTRSMGNARGGSTSRVPFLSLPDRKGFLDLVVLSGPIFFVILAKVACYSAMTFRVSDFGVTPLAAQSIMMRIFFFFGCFGDSVSQAAQSFLPKTLYPKPKPDAFSAILRRLILVAFVIGVVNSQVSEWILRACGAYLTNDLDIIRIMADNSRFLGAALFLHPSILVLEGTVMTARDFKTMVATYSVTLALHFCLLKYVSATFPAVWRTFFLFQSIRLVNFGWHVARKFRRKNHAYLGEAGLHD